MSDFTRKALLQKLNRKNFISRIEKLERLQTAMPSSRVEKVDEIVQTTGTLYDADFGSVFIDADGIHSDANVMDINWWLPLNLANDNITSIRAIVYDGTEFVYVGGQMSSIGGLPIPTGYGVARYSLITRNWQVIGRMNGMVYALVYWGGKIYAGGAFTTIDGTGGYNHIARGTSAFEAALGGGCTGGDVLGLAADGNGVYLTGSFTSADSVANTLRIAKFNGTVFSALGTGLAGTDGQVLVVAGSDIWVGGNFTGAGGVANTAYIARWNGSTWNSVGVFNGQVKALAYDSESAVVYAGGAFTTIDAVAFVRVAKYINGGWAAMADLNGDVYALQIYNDGVIAGGAFTDAGEDLLADRFAVFIDDRWESMSNAGGLSGLDGFVYALLVMSNGSIIAGGSFNFAGSIQCQSIAVYCKPLSDAIDIIASLFELYAPPYGTYTPTLTNTTNVAASTAYVTAYYRVGNMVSVFGKVDIDPTAGSATTLLGMSLPIASTFANDFELGGTGVWGPSSSVPSAVGIFADTTNNRAYFRFLPGDGVNRPANFQFSYNILP